MWRRLHLLGRLLGRDALVLWYAWRDPFAPRAFKLGAALLTLYVLSPIDLVPDWLPLLGWLDDAALLALLLPALLKRLPDSTRRRAEMAASERVARWRHT